MHNFKCLTFFDLTQEVRGVHKVKRFAYMLRCATILSLVFDMQHDHFQKCMFWPFDLIPGIEGVYKAQYVLELCSILHSR